jgi:hypothetical protein
MADHIHMALASFREEILTSTARLEFQLRDMNQRIAAQINNPNAVRGCTRNNTFWAEESDSDVISVQRHDELENRIRVLEATIQTLLENQQKVASSKASSVTTTIELDLLSMQAPENTRNIIVKSHCGTPALAAAVAAANAPQPPALVLPVVAAAVGVVEAEEDEVVEEATVIEEEEDVADEVVGEAAAEDTHEVVEEEVEEGEEENEDDGPTLTRMVLNNQVYFLDEENTAYQMTEDGYEEVGVFNPITKRVEVTVEEAAEEEEEQEEEEEEEEGIEVEEFLYKGKTYARDTDNNVYLDGEQIGTWNGKKIVLQT